MKLRRILPAVVALVAAASSLGAQVQVTVTSPTVPGGTPVAWDPPEFGGAFYVSPYTGVIQGQTGSVILNCVDFFHHVTLNAPFMANRTYLNSGNLTATRFNNLTLYLQAAWLTQQYTANPGSAPDRTIAIQAAIWNILTPAAPDKTNGSGTTSQAYWVNQAQQNYNANDAYKYYILTATNKNDPNSAQEFLVYDVNAVPEPATLTLLGTGIVGLAGVARRRRQKAAEAKANIA